MDFHAQAVGALYPGNMIQDFLQFWVTAQRFCLVVINIHGCQTVQVPKTMMDLFMPS